MSVLAGKRIIVGISGGIAAYKSAQLVRLLKKQQAEVQVVMTTAAQSFVTPLTFQALTGREVRTTLLDPTAEAGMGHIELAKWAELIVIAPASANTLAQLAHGFASDLLSTLCLASSAPISVVPAMNQQMWHAQATQENICKLSARGVQIWGPAQGEQACGDQGYGRMIEPEQIDQQIQQHFSMSNILQGQKVMITAGPTFEPLDPVRFMGNRSSGKMGYALAQAFANAGADVLLITGPTALKPPTGVKVERVESCLQMLDKVEADLAQMDVFVGCAAVADYRAEVIESQKIKKGDDQLVLTLVKNPDIITKVATSQNRPKLVIGFAAETQNVSAYALEKLQKKGLDMICANDVSNENMGFGSDENRILLISKQCPAGIDLGVASTKSLAKKVVQTVADYLS